MDIKESAIREVHEEYDISEYEHLLYYEKGDTIHPDIMESVGKSFVFYNSVLEEDTYKELLEKEPAKRCQWLIANNRHILLRDIDWEKIFTDIEVEKKHFGRFYPMMRMLLDSEKLLYLTKAIVLNDDFYSYCFELEKKYNEY